MRALFQIVIFRRVISKIIIPNQGLIRNNDLISYELFCGNLGPVSTYYTYGVVVGQWHRFPLVAAGLTSTRASYSRGGVG